MPSPKSRARAFRICHLSDLHVPLREATRPHELANKRLLGWLNLKLSRGSAHRLDVLEGLLSSVGGERADLHVITGDFSNLALDREFAEAGALLARFGLTPDNTIIVPGNHDRYTISADLGAAFERGLAPFAEGDVGRTRRYPRTRILGPVALAALDTAVWRGPIRAAGRLDAAQADRLAAFLDGKEAEGLWPVIAMHHPPFELEGDYKRQYRVGLEGREHLSRALAGRSGTIIHGHLHALSRRAMGDFDAIGVTSASHDGGGATAQAAYHVYAFDRAGLLDATIVRFWPGPNGGRRERVPLPKEA
ncbi:MAG: metallophosphoesterase [Proteobacteria bacterium]|jgi:3',5'-cyclic AMP phosphodiesterase CpdA|nr:metallophosphoesterase [Pseudomonadota bacterium]